MLKRETWESVGVIAAMAVVILIPALISGFPFVDYDSMSYLSTAYDRVIPENRPVYYSIFTLALDWAISPWPIVFAQAALVATLIWHVAKVMFGVSDWRVLIGVAALLTAASSLPWYAGYLTPDVFTSLMMVALLMLGLCWDRLSVVARWLYGLLIAACVAFHYGNVAIAFGANFVFGVLALLGWRAVGQARPRFLMINGAALLGVLALVTATTYDHGKLAMSPSSGSFYLARLLDDGPALRVLDRDCARDRWALCAQLPAISAYIEGRRAHPEDPHYRFSVADFFLWGGPLQRAGDFETVEPQAGEIIRETWASYPVEQAQATARNAMMQFASFRFGEFLHTWPAEPGPTIQRMFGDHVYRDYVHSLQERNALDFQLMNMAGYMLIAASVLLLGYQAWRSYAGDRFWFYVSVALLCFLLGNAFTTGVFSGVFSNYQARVIWLVPLFGLLLAARAYWKPKPA